MHPPRLGPRPLPLRGTSLMTLASACRVEALEAWLAQARSPDSAPPESLAALLPEIAAPRGGEGRGLRAALHREIARRLRRLADGVIATAEHPVHRTCWKIRPPSGAKATRVCSTTARRTALRGGVVLAPCSSCRR